MPNELPTDRPTGLNEYTLDIGPDTYTVWEFPFKDNKVILGYDLTGCSGYVFPGNRLITIDSNLSIRNKKWTLDHEVAHILRWQEGSGLGEDLWDEFETELMVLAKTDPRDFSSIRSEVYTALRQYLLGGRNYRRRARMLVNFLRERINDSTKEGRRKPVKLPRAALLGVWWDRISD